MKLSWSLTVHRAADDERSVRALLNERRAEYLRDTDQPDHVREAVNEATVAALELVESGMVGSADKGFTVTLSGHANEGHEPTEGWVNDCVTVSVVQQ